MAPCIAKRAAVKRYEYYILPGSDLRPMPLDPGHRVIDERALWHKQRDRVAHPRVLLQPGRAGEIRADRFEVRVVDLNILERNPLLPPVDEQRRVTSLRPFVGE